MKLILLLIALSWTAEAQFLGGYRKPNNFYDSFEGTGNQININTSISSYADFLNRMHPGYYGIVITRDATYTNIAPTGWIVDPSDASKFILYVAEFLGNTRVGSRTSAYTGDISDPYTLTYNSVVLTEGASGFDNDGAALGSVIEVAGTIYYYYSARATPSNIQSVGVVTSTDGFTFSSRTQCLAPDVTNETGLTDPFVFYEGGTFYMYVTKKTGAVPNTLPVGLIIATSSDGLTFTKNGVTAVGLGTGNDADAKYIEGGQVIKFGSDYVLCYNGSSNSDVWSINAATSTSPTTAFTKGPVVIEHVPARESVAVPLIVNTSGTQWVVYVQASNQFQPASEWDVDAYDMNTKEYRPGGFLTTNNAWVGDLATWDVAAQGFVSSGTRSLRGLKNTGNTNISHAINITASASASVSLKMTTTAATGAFRGGFYIMEGANAITGVYFNSGNISELRSSGWVTAQAYSANTTYTIEILVVSNTQHTLKINGTTILTNASNFANIVTKADAIKMEKSQTQTTIVYFDDILCTN